MSSTLSEQAIEIIGHSLAPGTSKQYKYYLTRWEEYCNGKNIDPYKATVQSGIAFLTELYHSSNIGYSAINTARSALSLVIESDSEKFGSLPLVRRFMRGIFKLRPSLPKYMVTYDTYIVFEYLERIDSENPETPLKEVSYKLAMILCLLSGQRNQSIAALDINHMELTEDKCIFFIPKILKTTRPGHHLEPITLKRYQTNQYICPVTLVRLYLHRTSKLRNNATKLILSYKSPHCPVTSSTLARWCKEVLKAAGIDSKIFTAHSTRGSSTSLAYSKGLSLNDIRKAAGWTNNKTFAKFYNRPIMKNLSETILS